VFDFPGLSGLLAIKSGTVETAVLKRTFPQTPLIKTDDFYKWDKRNISPNIIIPLVVHNIMFNFDNVKWYDNSTKNEVNIKVQYNFFVLISNYYKF